MVGHISGYLNLRYTATSADENKLISPITTRHLHHILLFITEFTMGGEKKDQDPVERAIELAKPVLSQLSFGAVMGYCSGTAMKKIGKAVAFCRPRSWR